MDNAIVKFNRNGESGNIFHIIGEATKELKRIGKKRDADEMTKKVCESPDYETALKIIGEYVILIEE